MEFRDQPSCLELDREKDGLERGGERGHEREGEVHCFQSGMFFPETLLFPKSLQPDCVNL